MDHKVPLAKGGEDSEANLVASCRDCNGGKGCVLLGSVFPEWLKTLGRPIQPDPGFWGLLRAWAGDFAEDARQDAEFPSVDSYSQLRDYLTQSGACYEARLGALHAWRMFQRFRKGLDNDQPSRIITEPSRGTEELHT